MHKLIKGLLLSFVGLVFAGNAYAIDTKVSITALPEYTKTNSLKLQYSAISSDPITAQFYFRKDGNAYAPFGAAITGSNGVVQTTDVQVNDQAKYFFKVVLGSGQESETSTTYDVTGPGEPGGFSKERVGVTTYKIKWHTPNSEDFATVIIYRGVKSDIEANSGAEVARVGGTKDTDYEWVDNGVEIGKDYYYVIRAIDKAGNTSNLIGDSELVKVLGISTTSVSSTPSTTGKAGSVVVLPKEGTGEGQVLNESTEVVEETVNTDKELESGVAKTIVKRITSSWLLSGAVILAFIAGLTSYFISKNKK
jgi:hypothetical protein